MKHILKGVSFSRGIFNVRYCRALNCFSHPTIKIAPRAVVMPRLAPVFVSFTLQFVVVVSRLLGSIAEENLF